MFKNHSDNERENQLWHFMKEGNVLFNDTRNTF